MTDPAQPQRPMGTCPVCNDSKRVPATGECRSVCGGYDKATDTFPCYNCGGQKQWQVATGLVRLRPDGTPCTHDYDGKKLGNCYWGYLCKHCGDYFTIDSSD
jgi:hypothetical protein